MDDIIGADTATAIDAAATTTAVINTVYGGPASIPSNKTSLAATRSDDDRVSVNYDVSPRTEILQTDGDTAAWLSNGLTL